jgi:hypothetical protein
MLELWVAIPAGFVLKINPFLTGGIAIAGSIWSVLLVAVIGDKAVKFIMKLRGKQTIKKTGRTFKIWEKYGIPGLGIISPLLLGAPLGTAIGITLGGNIIRIIVWMCIGIVFWSAVLTASLWFGLMNIPNWF